MENLPDEEIIFQEDSTASSSSLATALSEEDDLRLGAEANSFTLDKNVSNMKPRSRQPEYWARKLYTEPEYDMSHSYSTISSIKDLLDARDPDAEEVLFNLGFAADNGQNSRESILSRFSSPHVLDVEQLHFQQQGASSITKTREWLEKHGGDANMVSTDSKSRQISSTSNTEFNGTFPSKRQMSRPKALRKKWSSKSRQSSFDRLPNLKEEDPIAEERKSLSGPEILTRRSSSPNLPIKNTSAFDNVKPIKNEPNYSDSGPVVISLSKIKGSGDGEGRSLINSKAVGLSNTNLPGNSLQHTLMKNLKSDELKEAQTDSFELEEIMSRDGHLEELTNKLQTNKSVVTNRRRRQGVVANPLNPSVDATPTSMISEASSGFCELLDQPTKVKSILPIVSQSESGGNASRSLVNAVAKRFHCNFQTIECLENNFKSYCEEKASIVCASAIAKAALILQHLHDRAHNKYNMFSTLPEKSNGKANIKHCEKGSPLYRCFSTETLKTSKCARHRQPKHSFSYNPNTRLKSHVPKLTRFHSLPQLNCTLNDSFEKEEPTLMSSISEVSLSAQSTLHKFGHSSKALGKPGVEEKLSVVDCKSAINLEADKVKKWENLNFETEKCPECHQNFELSLKNKEENHFPEILTGNAINNNIVDLGDLEKMKENLLKEKNAYNTKKVHSPLPASLMETLTSGTDISHLFPIQDVSVTVNGHG